MRCVCGGAPRSPLLPPPKPRRVVPPSPARARSWAGPRPRERGWRELGFPCAFYVLPVPVLPGGEAVFSEALSRCPPQEGQPAFPEGIPGPGVLKHSTQVPSQWRGHGTLGRVEAQEMNVSPPSLQPAGCLSSQCLPPREFVCKWPPRSEPLFSLLKNWPPIVQSPPAGPHRPREARVQPPRAFTTELRRKRSNISPKLLLWTQKRVLFGSRRLKVYLRRDSPPSEHWKNHVYFFFSPLFRNVLLTRVKAIF